MKNKTILVKIVDQQIRDAMTVAYDIGRALDNNDHVTLDFMNESPALTCTEFAEFFDHLEHRGIDLSRLKLITGNLIERVPKVETVRRPECMIEISEVKRYIDQVPRHKDIRFHFINLVGRCNWPRMLLSAHLYRFHRERSLQSFHWRPDTDFTRNHMQLEDILHEYGPCSVEFDSVVDLLRSSPLTLDRLSQGYPIQHAFNIATPCSWYPQVFVDVVCETWWQGDNFFITEKFLRSVITRTPFILQAARGTLARLRKLGFQTFGAYWDEGYDEDPAHHNLVGIKSVIDQLGLLSVGDLQEMWHDMQPILDHNLQRFADLTYEDLQHI